MKLRNLTINDLPNQFIEEKRLNGVSEATLTAYRDALDLFLTKDISKIDKKLIDKFISSRIKDMNPQSLNAYLGRIRVFCYWLMENDYIEPFKINLVKCQEPIPRFYSTEEIDKLLSYKPVNYIEHRTQVVILFILSCGARANTICNVRVDDIKDSAVSLLTTKNKRSMEVPLTDRFVIGYRKFYNKWDIKEYAFANKGNSKCTPSALRQAMRKYCDKVGVEYKGIHALRHTFAREWVLRGGGVFQLQHMLGHSSIEMTRHYVQIFSTDIEVDKYTY